MNLSKLNRITHRDMGYLIAGMTIIYSLSGIALNHKYDWNPNYIVDSYEFRSEQVVDKASFNDEKAKAILRTIPGSPSLKTWHLPSGNRLTIFIEGGFVQVNTATGEGVVERISKRPLFYQINFLHYNPGRWWKFFSDTFCISLMLVTITGLFIIKGKNGITRRGAILTAVGIFLPLLFLLIY